MSRSRAYVLFELAGEESLQSRIASYRAKSRQELFEIGGDAFVIVRVEGISARPDGPYGNILVPVDAEDAQQLATAISEVERALGVHKLVELDVIDTFPAPPTRAHCFVTADEHRAYPLHEYSPPGRHPKSPGANPWG